MQFFNILRLVVSGILALGLCAVSVTCNYLFGTHLATGFEGQVYGFLGGIAAALKADFVRRSE